MKSSVKEKWKSIDSIFRRVGYSNRYPLTRSPLGRVSLTPEVSLAKFLGYVFLTTYIVMAMVGYYSLTLEGRLVIHWGAGDI